MMDRAFAVLFRHASATGWNCGGSRPLGSHGLRSRRRQADSASRRCARYPRSRTVCRAALCQRPAARHQSHRRARSLSLPWSRREADQESRDLGADQKSCDPPCLEGGVDRAGCRCPSAGDGPRCARPQAISLSRRFRPNPRCGEICPSGGVCRGAARLASPPQARSWKAGLAAGENSRRHRDPAGADPDPRRQRGLCPRQ